VDQKIRAEANSGPGSIGRKPRKTQPTLGAPEGPRGRDDPAGAEAGFGCLEACEAARRLGWKGRKENCAAPSVLVFRSLNSQNGTLAGARRGIPGGLPRQNSGAEQCATSNTECCAVVAANGVVARIRGITEAICAIWINGSGCKLVEPRAFITVKKGG
jgi:hypothetical protein